eukprot:403373694
MPSFQDKLEQQIHQDLNFHLNDKIDTQSFERIHLNKPLISQYNDVKIQQNNFNLDQFGTLGKRERKQSKIDKDHIYEMSSQQLKRQRQSKAEIQITSQNYINAKNLPKKQYESHDEEEIEDEEGEGKKKDKKLVFLSKSVLQKIKEKPMTTGTQIANEILELYKQFQDVNQKVDFKNVQRRVYDALNVLNAMDIIRKDKNQIFFNEDNEHIPGNIHDSESEEEVQQKIITKESVSELRNQAEEMREILRVKQETLLEETKQIVAINKLLERNMMSEVQLQQQMQKQQSETIQPEQASNSKLQTPKSEQGALTTAEEQSSIVNYSTNIDRISIPMTLIFYKKDSEFEIKADNNFQNVQIYSDREFVIQNENHIFKELGLAQVSEDDLRKYFNEDFINYMRNQEFFDSSDSQKQTQKKGFERSKLQTLDIQPRLKKFINDQAQAKKFSPAIISNTNLQKPALQYSRDLSPQVKQIMQSSNFHAIANNLKVKANTIPQEGDKNSNNNRDFTKQNLVKQSLQSSLDQDIMPSQTSLDSIKQSLAKQQQLQEAIKFERKNSNISGEGETTSKYNISSNNFNSTNKMGYGGVSNRQQMLKIHNLTSPFREYYNYQNNMIESSFYNQNYPNSYQQVHFDNQEQMNNNNSYLNNHYKQYENSVQHSNEQNPHHQPHAQKLLSFQNSNTNNFNNNSQQPFGNQPCLINTQDLSFMQNYNQNMEAPQNFNCSFVKNVIFH